MLTTFDDREYIVRSLRSGAVGYLLKDLPARIRTGNQQVVKGVFLANGEVMSKLLGSLNAQEDFGGKPGLDSNALEQYNFLSPREQKVPRSSSVRGNESEIAISVM